MDDPIVEFRRNRRQQDGVAVEVQAEEEQPAAFEKPHHAGQKRLDVDQVHECMRQKEIHKNPAPLLQQVHMHRQLFKSTRILVSPASSR